MYSVVMMMALTGGAEAPDFGHRSSCSSCSGCSCYISSCSGCHSSCHSRGRLFGGRHHRSPRSSRSPRWSHAAQSATSGPDRIGRSRTRTRRMRLALMIPAVLLAALMHPGTASAQVRQPPQVAPND